MHYITTHARHGAGQKIEVLIMMIIKGKMYIKGTVDISAKALMRLAEMGVTPPKNRFPQGGEFDSFFLPEGEDGGEFIHRHGSPASAGDLLLRSEV